MLKDVSDISTLCIDNPTTYPAFESVFAINPELYIEYIQKYILKIVPENNIQFLDIILKYFSTNNTIIENIIKISIMTDNINIINHVSEYNLTLTLANIIPSYYELLNHGVYHLHNDIKIDTILALEKFGINILDHINLIAILFYHNFNLPGIIFCLENGADPNYILSKMNYFDKDIIKYLLIHNADLNKLTIDQIKCAVSENNLDSFKYLIENGLGLLYCLNDLLLYVCIHGYLNSLQYLIDIGADIHFDDNILLFSACYVGNIEIVKLLLQLGLDDDNILLFMEKDYSKYDYIELKISGGFANWFQIAKILIKNGCKINNPSHTFWIYADWTRNNFTDIELFTIFLEYGIDFNYKYLTLYVFERVVGRGSIKLLNLCLKYGADPYINNSGPLTLALHQSRLNIVKILLDVGCIVDPNLERNVDPNIIDLLNERQIDHKLLPYEIID